MKESFFSIIITAYNSEKYIKRCISSLLNQNFGDYEIIIIDDCSTDNTSNVIKNIKDKRINLIKLPKNKGVSFCRNLGLKKAKGKYIYFVDYDDFCETTLLKRAYDELKLHPCEVLFFPYVLFVDEKQHAKRNNSSRSLKMLMAYNRPFNIEDVGESLLDLNYEVWNKIFDKNFLLKNEIYFKEDLSFSEDLVFYCNFLKFAKKATYLADTGYFYRFVYKKKFEKSHVIKQFEKAFNYIKDDVIEKWGRDFYIKKVSAILNYWIIKLEYDKDLYEFALKMCGKEEIVNVNNIFQRMMCKFVSKVKNFL